MTAGSAMDSLYAELILDHARSPRRAGLREPFDAEVHHVNPTCGDEVTLRVRMDGDRLADLSYDALGCSISIAGASVAAEELTGVDLPTAMQRYQRVLAVLQGRVEADPETDGDVAAFAGVRRFPARVKCALLGWAAARDALLQAAGTDAAGTDADGKSAAASGADPDGTAGHGAATPHRTTTTPTANEETR